MLQEIGAFSRVTLLAFKGLFSWMNPVIYLMSMLILPLFHVIFYVMLGRFSQANSLEWYLVGNAIVVCAYNAIFGVGGSLSQDRTSGTLSLVLISPRSKLYIFAGRTLILALHGFATSALGFIVGWVGFGLDLSHANWAVLIPVMVLTTLTAGGLGLLIAAISLVVVDTNMLLNLGVAILVLLVGVNFPVSMLPAPLQWISSILPLQRGVSAARLLVSGAALKQVSPLLIQESCVGVLYLLAGYLLFLLMERRARGAGTLDLY